MTDKEIFLIAGLSFLSLLITGSCNREPAPLFAIQDTADLLFLAESTNVGAIPPDDLTSWLHPEEVATAQAGRQRWELWSEVYRDSTRQQRILLKEQLDHPGRHYEFLLRSYAPDGRILATHLIGQWIDGQGYCYGRLSAVLELTTVCEL
jgi:hypothetical protein